MVKPVLVAFALLLLTACDKENVPPAPVPQEQPSVPASDSAETPPDLQIEVAAPTTQQGEIVKPEVTISVPEPPAAPSTQKKTVPVQVEEIELNEPKLDLSLPADWAKEFEVDDSSEAMSLLPPLFSEPKRSVQMSGRLITGEEEDEPLIEGAEIQFEFKR